MMYIMYLRSLILALFALAFASAAQAASPYMWTKPDVAGLESLGTACGVTATSAYVQGVGIYQWNSTSTATPEEAR